MRDLAKGCCAALALAAQITAFAAPAHAGACWTERTVAAAQLRQLDVMLMVGSLQCRTGADDYRADYDRFLLRHRDYLGTANHLILDDISGRVGPLAAMDALDHASVRMANHYGMHSTYGCHELKLVAISLANSADEELDHAADVMVGPELEDGGCASGAAIAGAGVVPVPAKPTAVAAVAQLALPGSR